MRLDLNWQLKNIELLGFSDEEIKNSENKESLHAGKLLATLLVKSTDAENPVKFFDWALSLHRGEAIEVDKGDMEILKKFVKGHANLFALVKAQILEAIRVVLDSKEK